MWCFNRFTHHTLSFFFLSLPINFFPEFKMQCALIKMKCQCLVNCVCVCARMRALCWSLPMIFWFWTWLWIICDCNSLLCLKNQNTHTSFIRASIYARGKTKIRKELKKKSYLFARAQFSHLYVIIRFIEVLNKIIDYQ